MSSATITLNGTQVATPADFAQPVPGFDRPVSLQGSNTLQVRLTSVPGSFLVLGLYGTVPSPTLTTLEPPTLPITQGATGTLTATLSAAPSEATILTLQSNDPSVATIPATAAKLYKPLGVAVDAQGTLFIADEANHRIRKVDPNVIITTLAGGGGTYLCAGQAVAATSVRLTAPTGVAADGQGTLYIAEIYGVVRVGPDGLATRKKVPDTF